MVFRLIEIRNKLKAFRDFYLSSEIESLIYVLNFNSFSN